MSILTQALRKIVHKLIPSRPQKIPSGLTFKISFCDVGAAGGLLPEAQWLSPILNIIGFEPDPRSLEETRRKMLELQTSSCTLISKAVAEKDGSRVLYLTKKPQCSSFYQPNKNLLGCFPESSRFNIEKTIELDCMPLSSLGTAIDWLKVDTQGSELSIIKGLEEKISETLVIDVEIEILEMYSGQPLLKDMLEYLQRTHQIIRCDIVNWRGVAKHEALEILMNSKGRSIFANTLWLNKELLPESFQTKNKELVMKSILLLLSYRQFSLASQIAEISLKNGLLSDLEKEKILSVFQKSGVRYLLGKLISNLFGLNRAFLKNKYNFDEE